MDSTLSPERAEQISTLFDAIVDLTSDERAAYLERACADDADLRRQVEALLEADDQPDEVFHKLDHPVPGAPDRLIGQRISRYRIVEKLGGGGMGVVYRAEDMRLRRHVALKFLPPDMTRDPEARQRFVREAQAASALDHPNICTIYEIDETDEGDTFIAMACYEGGTLKKKIARGPLPVDEAISFAIQIAEGLSRAHIMTAVEDSLRRLGTDYVDLYQTHWPDEDTPLEEITGRIIPVLTSSLVLHRILLVAME